MNEVKSILYIGGFELPDKNAAAHRVLSNAKIFRKLGYNVIFIGVDKSGEKFVDIQSTKTSIQGFESYRVPYPRGNKSWILYLTDIRLYVNIIKQYEKIYMIVLYNFQAIAMKKLLSYCRKHSIMCCADVTEWRSSKGENIIYRCLKGTDTWYRMKILHKRLDGLIVISRYLKKYYKNTKNVILIPTLVDTKEEKWNNPFIKSKDNLILVYAGSPGRKDKLDVLVNSIIAINRPCCLEIIGITKEQFVKSNPKMKRVIDENNRVIFHGRVSHLKALNFVKRANYSCFFRENNRVSNAGFPTKLAEAISCGTPVITNNTSDIGDYISNDKNGYLLSGYNIDEITKVLNNANIEMIVDKNLFDYNKYIESMRTFLKHLLCTNV